jgi:hypothetical protein
MHGFGGVQNDKKMDCQMELKPVTSKFQVRTVLLSATLVQICSNFFLSIKGIVSQGEFFSFFLFLTCDNENA